MTLAKALVPSQSLLARALMVVGGSLFIAIAAQISVPMLPVPMTLQTLAILIVGLTFGARMGALTVLAYLGEGAMGLPVFANGGNGAAFFGPTAGFLVGFVMMAAIVGYAADRGVKGLVGTAAVALLASALLVHPGRGLGDGAGRGRRDRHREMGCRQLWHDLAVLHGAVPDRRHRQGGDRGAGGHRGLGGAEGPQGLISGLA